MQRFLFFIFILFCMTAQAGEPVRLYALVVQPGKDSTTLSFTLSQKTSGRVKYLPNPNRVIIDLANTKKSFTMKNARFGVANVTSMTTEEIPNGVRFVLQVKDKVKWTIQFIPSDSNKTAIMLEITITSLPPVSKPAAAPTNTVPVKSIDEVTPPVSQREQEEEHHWVGRSRLEASRHTTPPPILTVIIDAGHGGKDPGASGKDGLQEKEVVLAIAKKLTALINQSKHVRAILTRDGDYFVPLRGRLALARKNNADLFIAIHADAYFNNEVMGASVYALSHRGATSEAARWLAQKENYSELDGVELNELKDHSLVLRSVLIDLAQTTSIRDSLRLGNTVLDALDNFSSMHHRNVEQAPFMVLKSPDIPSILVETGFITNPYEEKRLRNPAYQDKIAAAIWQGIDQYVQIYYTSIHSKPVS